MTRYICAKCRLSITTNHSTSKKAETSRAESTSMELLPVHSMNGVSVSRELWEAKRDLPLKHFYHQEQKDKK